MQLCRSLQRCRQPCKSRRTIWEYDEPRPVNEPFISRSNLARHHVGSASPSLSHVQSTDTSKQESRIPRRVTFAEDPIYIQCTTETSETIASQPESALRKPSLVVLSNSKGGPIRLKVMVSKRRLESVLNDSPDALTIVKRLVDPLLREREASSAAKDGSAWKARSNEA